MNLTKAALRSVLFGAAELREEQGGLRGYKCTEPVRENWGRLADFLKTYASHSTGIRLDFHTDADRVEFLLSGGKFELKIDGLTVAVKAMPETAAPFSAHLPAGEHRVTLIFPAHGNGTVYGLSLSDSASFRPHEYREKIHFLGDSITQGWDAELDSLSYAWQVSEFFDADCVIHGVGGGYFHPSVFERAPFEPDRVILALGTNDHSWGHSMEQMQAFTSAYLDALLEAYDREKILCILPIWRSEESKREDLRAFFDETVAMIRREYEIRGLSFVDGLELVPPRPEFFTKDLLHPNALGFGLYARNLIRRMI